MRPVKVPEKAVFTRLTDVFCEKGYPGASYADLMNATGLVKASLYHRFPGGKEEIANAILSQVDGNFSRYVLKPAWEEGAPEQRARQMARRLAAFYKAGRRSCLLDTLTLSSSPKTLKHARRSMEFWIESFARLSRQAGLSATLARRRAEDAVAAIEGGLILARVTKNRRPFRHALTILPNRLTKPVGNE